MSKHTPGPIEIRYFDALYAADGYELMCTWDRAQSRANAEHAAACWNACEGINPEAVPKLLAACKALVKECRCAMDGRDDFGDMPEDRAALEQAEAAIATAERNDEPQPERTDDGKTH